MRPSVRRARPFRSRSAGERRAPGRLPGRSQRQLGRDLLARPGGERDRGGARRQDSVCRPERCRQVLRDGGTSIAPCRLRSARAGAAVVAYVARDNESAGLAAHNDQWPQPPVYPPSWWWGAGATLLIGAAALLLVRGARAAVDGTAAAARTTAGAAAAAGAFVVVTVVGLLDFDWTQARTRAPLRSGRSRAATEPASWRWRASRP
jgi:hypothetical protein